MKNFNVGDWVYGDDWCYGKITDICDGVAQVEFDTGTGGGSFSFGLDELTLAAPSDLNKIAQSSKYAVVVTFSFDSTVSVVLFDTWAQALDFIKIDCVDEWKIDTQENGWDSEYEIFEADGRAVVTTHFDDRDDVTEWRIGDVYIPIE
jgi:hypothetical protein